MLYMTVPLDEQISKRLARGVKDNHLRSVAERIACGARALTPLDILSDIDSSKWANEIKIRFSQDQISSARKAMLLDIKFKTVRKHAFVSLECTERRSVFTPDLNVTPQNGSRWRGVQHTESTVKPVRMRTAIRIYERQNVASRCVDTSIARHAGSRPRFQQ